MKFWRLAIFVEIQSIIFKYDYIKVWPSVYWTCRVWEGQGKKKMLASSQRWNTEISIFSDQMGKAFTLEFKLIGIASHQYWSHISKELFILWKRLNIWWLIIYFLSKHLCRPSMYVFTKVEEPTWVFWSISTYFILC